MHHSLHPLVGPNPLLLFTKSPSRSATHIGCSYPLHCVTEMSPGGLLSFHHAILEEIHDPSTSQLVLLARGLGLRKVVCTLMQIYDQSTNLVLLVNASSEEEATIGEELSIMGCRKPGLRAVGYEMGKKDR
jgi:hypothetical protein